MRFQSKQKTEVTSLTRNFASAPSVITLYLSYLIGLLSLTMPKKGSRLWLSSSGSDAGSDVESDAGSDVQSGAGSDVQSVPDPDLNPDLNSNSSGRAKNEHGDGSLDSGCEMLCDDCESCGENLIGGFNFVGVLYGPQGHDCGTRRENRRQRSDADRLKARIEEFGKTLGPRENSRKRFEAAANSKVCIFALDTARKTATAEIHTDLDTVAFHVARLNQLARGMKRDKKAMRKKLVRELREVQKHVKLSPAGYDAALGPTLESLMKMGDKS